MHISSSCTNRRLSLYIGLTDARNCNVVYLCTGACVNMPTDPSIQIRSTLGPKVCDSYLHWANWILRVF